MAWAMQAVRVSGLFRGLHTSRTVLGLKKVLPDETVAQFKRDGWVVCKDFLSPKDKKDIINWTEEVQGWKETKGKWMQYFEYDEGKKLLCRTENFLDFHPQLKEFITVKLNDAVGQLFGEESVLFKEKINFKLPGGKGFKPHQDAPAWTTFNQNRHITATVAIDASTKENGCMYLVKGEHTKGTFQHIDGAIPEHLCIDWQWHPLLCDPGDVAFFDSYVPHRSFDNRSPHSRRVHYITYNPKTDGDYRLAYYADKREHFPPDIERVKGKDYSAGGKVYNLGNPIATKGM